VTIAVMSDPNLPAMRPPSPPGGGPRPPYA